MKIQLFFFFFSLFFSPCFVDGTVCPPTTINICARFLILRCKLQFVPVHVHHFLQLEGARPPAEPSPITNYKLCRLAAMSVDWDLVEDDSSAPAEKDYSQTPCYLEAHCNFVCGSWRLFWCVNYCPTRLTGRVYCACTKRRGEVVWVSGEGSALGIERMQV